MDIPAQPEKLQERRMSGRARRQFTEQFKAEAVQLARSSGKSVGQIAKDLDLTETPLCASAKTVHVSVFFVSP